MSVLFLSKLLVFAFVGSVTLWYFFTPYLVQPHPGIIQDLLTRSSLSRQAPAAPPGRDAVTTVTIENWTKWRAYVHIDHSEQAQTIYTASAKPIFLQSQAVINLEWRPEYSIVVQLTEHGRLSAQIVAPALSCKDWGLYNHLDVIVEGQVVKVVPRFLFGMSVQTMEAVYGSPGQDILQRLPIIGAYLDTNFQDRLLIHGYMAIVIVSIVFLLVANNPPSSFGKGLPLDQLSSKQK